MRLKPQVQTVKESSIDFNECHAKTGSDGLVPGTKVLDHCRYAGAVAEGLLSLCTEHVRKFLPEKAAFCVSVHDIGKVSPGFQGKYFLEKMSSYASDWVERWNRTNTLHAEVGAIAIAEILGVEREHPLVQAVAAHHGKFYSCTGLNYDGKAWQKARENLVFELARIFKANERDVVPLETDPTLLAGLMCVADWLSSDEDFFNPDEPPLLPTELETRVHEILMEAGFRSYIVQQGLAFEDVFGFSPRDEQKALYESVDSPGVYVMEATMGAGKTEAALFAAYKMLEKGVNNGIYFALPTRLTSDRVHLRVERFLKRILEAGAAVRLSHGQAWLKAFERGIENDEENGRVPAWFSPSKRGLLYPFAVGTIDQALLSVMHVRHGFVRKFALAGKVVILDEVHSYDLYTGTLLDSLVNCLRSLGCTVIILSATLTEARRRDFLPSTDFRNAGYPCVCGEKKGREEGFCREAQSSRSSQNVRINWLVPGLDAAISDSLLKARQGCNVLCIANTVRQAQDWYRLLLQKMDEKDQEKIKVGLLHSRFPAFRRTEIEGEWMDCLGKESTSRPQGAILISTQIVEQSVDIDADYLVSELAPIDLLLQRVGRMWRHERAGRPVDGPVLSLALTHGIPVGDDRNGDSVKEAFGKGTSCVYAPYVLLRTWKVLQHRERLTIPSGIRGLLEAVYGPQEAVETVEREFLVDLEKRRTELRGLAQAAGERVTSQPAWDDDDENPPTRYSRQRTVKILLVRSCDDGVGHGRLQMELLDGQAVIVDEFRRDVATTAELYRNIVSVPMRGCFRGAPNQTRTFKQHFHSSDTPWICCVNPETGSVSVWNRETVETGVAFRNDLGVYSCQKTCMGGCVDDAGTGIDQDFIEEFDW